MVWPVFARTTKCQKTHAELQDQGFEVVGISIDRDLDALSAFLERDPLPWTTLSGDAAQAKARAGCESDPNDDVD